jgi:hypothetical protein
LHQVVEVRRFAKEIGLIRGDDVDEMDNLIPLPVNAKEVEQYSA